MKGKRQQKSKTKSNSRQKLYEHYKTIFGREPRFGIEQKKSVLQSDMPPITTLVFKPTDATPFWKLCTIGASDYLMPERDIGWGRKANRRNEYIMLIEPKAKIDEQSTEWLFFNSLLWSTAEYAFNSKENLTVSDTIDMGLDGKYCGTVILFPEVFKSPDIVKCYISEKEYVSIFQVMPITREQLSKKSESGADGVYRLMEQFYTHDDDGNYVSSKALVEFERDKQMLYFVNAEDRKESRSTCYFEFQKGKHKNKFWKSDSVNIAVSLWNEYELSDLFGRAVPDFGYYGITEVRPEQWKNILEICQNENPKGACVIEDVRKWVEECFKTDGCFTICGI